MYSLNTVTWGCGMYLGEVLYCFDRQYLETVVFPAAQRRMRLVDDLDRLGGAADGGGSQPGRLANGRTWAKLAGRLRGHSSL